MKKIIDKNKIKKREKMIAVKTIMSKVKLNMLFVVVLSTLLVSSSCSKHAEKIADTYVGALVKNGSSISTDAQVIIEEVTKDRVSISSGFFETYEVEIDRKRYWASKTFYSVDPDEHLEIIDEGTIILLQTDKSGDDFEFSGMRN